MPCDFLLALNRLLRFAIALLALATPLALGQALWLETGFAYAEQTCGNDTCMPIYLKLGARAMLPVAERVSLFVAP